MLNISRYSKEEVFFQFDENLESIAKMKVSIGHKNGRKFVTLSIEAPKSVKMLRAELLDPKFGRKGRKKSAKKNPL